MKQNAVDLNEERKTEESQQTEGDDDDEYGEMDDRELYEDGEAHERRLLQNHLEEAKIAKIHNEKLQ